MTQWYLRIYTHLNVEKIQQKLSVNGKRWPPEQGAHRERSLQDWKSPWRVVGGVSDREGRGCGRADCRLQTLPHEPSPPPAPLRAQGCGLHWLGEWGRAVATARRA